MPSRVAVRAGCSMIAVDSITTWVSAAARPAAESPASSVTPAATVATQRDDVAMDSSVDLTRGVSLRTARRASQVEEKRAPAAALAKLGDLVLHSQTPTARPARGTP